MSLTPVYTTAFKKDFKRLEKRGADLEKLRRVITLLLAGCRLKSSTGIIRCGANSPACATVILSQIGC